MEHEGFTSKDICAIIKECAKNGVIAFNLGDLHIDFVGPAIVHNFQAPEKANQALRNFPAPKNMHAEQEVEEAAMVQETSESLEEELATLQISDPYEYELLMAKGDLENAEEKDS